ncbi:hypothetical protein ACCO45_009026 [Purpureocillium lilacinum]|uniref:Uncharacterized protein n=1 Tax=Purpureocillium lilacinum TaxID=33203 RepID=A0ACC4DLF9_PURLI
MARLHILALLIAALVALASASCACTDLLQMHLLQEQHHHSLRAKKRRLLISVLSSPINIPELLAGPATRRRHQPSAPAGNTRRSASSSCSECTKAFCLSQGISFCKDAKEENVVTMCFQRDSNKDKIIVWGFILGTSGLLGWSAFKRVIEWREGRAMGRQDISYAPVTSGGQ